MGLGASLVESYSRVMDPPLRVMRWALLRTLWRMASPKVGSPDDVVPVVDGDLAGEQRAAAGVAVVEDCEDGFEAKLGAGMMRGTG